jgi:hypothetical protein
MQTQNKPINGWRVFFSIVYLAIAVGIVYFRRDEIFFLEPRPTSYQFDRFLWCLSASFFGFSVLAFQLRRIPQSPFPVYIQQYSLLSRLWFFQLPISSQHRVVSPFTIYHLPSVLSWPSQWTTSGN